MVIHDWRDETAYERLAQHDGGALAWEFLRRNPRYQAEWAEFNQTWQALEADYGRPPDRDFCAWKNDPRSWVPAGEENAGECRVDQDKVLIECAFGARWGFYKFPPDPRDAEAATARRIAWREPPPRDHLLEPGTLIDDEPACAAVLFDMALPLKPQLERVKRELAVLQRRRQREAGLVMRSIANLSETLVRELRLLDAEASGDLDKALPRLGGEERLAAARARRDGGYRELPWLPLK